jgi:RHS repeat-associated protein
MSATNPAGQVVRGLRYGLDAASRIVEMADLRQTPPADEDLTASFQYDDRYRLTSATYPTGVTTWQHDDLAKILSVKSDFGDPHLNVTNSYGESGAGPDALTHHGTEALTYDAAGRVTRDGERSYLWDAKGRLAKVERGKVIEEYVYAHDDSRAIKRTTTDGKTETTRYIEKDVEERNGTLVRYVYLGDERLARLDPVDVGPRTAPVTKTGDANLLAKHGDERSRPDSLGTVAGRIARKVLLPWGTLAFAALALALIVQSWSRKSAILLPAYASRAVTVTIATCLLIIAGLTAQACSSDHGSHVPTFREQSVEITTVPDGAEFYLADGQQSPLALANNTAEITSRTALHPFGHVRFQTGKSGDPWSFVGNEEDRGSGISDFHARPYRPELGVFLAVDPVGLLSPEQTIGNPTRLFAYAYAGSDPITQADANGLTFCDFARGMWDQGVEDVKIAAKATVASVRSNAALAMSGDIEGVAANVVVGAAHGMIQTVKDVGNFGDNFAKAVFTPSDYEAGRLAVKPVTTAMTVAAAVMGPRLALDKGGIRKGVSAGAKAEAKSALKSGPTVYRQGTFADPKVGWEGNFVKGRQWASDNPLSTPGYAKKYGLPAENSATPDWVVGGRVQGEYATRPAPASHNCPGNSGGAVEILPSSPSRVRLDWFHMPDK